MECKKISFGFSKLSKKPSLLPIKSNNSTTTKVELIKCLEGQEIKLVEEIPEEKPLIIPLKNTQKTSTALASLLKRRAVLLGEDEPEVADSSTIKPSISLNNGEVEDIEKRAARELLAEVQNNTSSEVGNNLVLPIVKPDDLPLEGANESTLDDYEHIPIQDFGKAMLRGMGWTDPLPKTDKKKGLPVDDTPMVRPKGMGLGADKSLSKKTLLIAPESNEVLEIKRNAFVRVLGGKYKDLYGQIEGFDDHAGRVIVKLAIGGAKEAFNEFLCQPVSRKEYTQYGKCINSSKYDEYKKKETEYGHIKLHKDNKDLLLKHEKKYSANDKYKVEKDIKQENDRARKKEENLNSVDYKYEDNKRNKEEQTYRKADRSWTDSGERKYDRSQGRDRHRDDEKYQRRDSAKDITEEKYQSSRSCAVSAKGYGDRQTKHDKSHCQVVENSSDSESDEYYSSKHKKSKKSRSKKSKKSKSKHRETSADTETTTSSSDSEQERTKKFRKKTKKSKKQRERSRSRGRR